MIARIAVASAVFSMDKPFDYRIPDSLTLQPGQRVRVPFGASNRRTEGIVLAVMPDGAERPDGPALKPVEAALDPEPLLSRAALHLAAFVRERYFCTFYDAVRAILPAGVWFQPRDRYTLAENAAWDDRWRNPAAQAVFQTLQTLGGAAEESALRAQFEAEALQRALQYLRQKKLVTCETSHRRLVTDKTERIAVLAVPAEEARRFAQSHQASAPVQAAAMELLATLGECACKELGYYAGATSATLRRLEKLEMLTLREQEVLPPPPPAAAADPKPLLLTPQQQAAYDSLSARLHDGSPGTALLYGVTGSGKTVVYLRLIDDCLAAGRGAIVLVPEIALTPQLLRQFSARYGARVAVLHSALRISERYETWKRIRSGDADVVLGTRSAVFAPVRDLGLLIVDEEQEHTYQSENAPRYHAREVAIYRGAQEHALTVLGSATPTVESMYRAVTGAFGLCRITERYNGRPLPPVEIVDMKRELREGNASIISEPLLLALRENLRLGQQSILYLNRRGTSRMLACVECGSVPMCPGCSLPLTYHHANGRLMCHICGHSEPVPARCPVCGGHLRQIGCGTQRVEEQLQNLLPGVGVLRMDADTVSAVNTHEKLFRRFREERIPILLGTQMVAKGLDFENVTLSAVLDADLSLYASDYRAAETTFSLIAQVAGRAGRGKLGGRAILQTMTPQNQTIRFAAEQNYDAFFEAELPLRQLRGCPPYRDLLTVTFHGREEERVWQAALAFRARLDGLLHSEFYRGETAAVLGPAPASVARINYHYRCRLTLSCVNTRRLRELLAFLVREFAKDRSFRGVGAFVDVNGRE